MPLTFHHFSRKGYALFAAMGREVRIGVLSVATLATAAPCLAQSQADKTAPQADGNERLLDEASVSAATIAPVAADVAARQVTSFSRDDIAAAGVTSINDLLKLCAGVDVRQRGPYGVQTDIGISGGTFDQVTILLNGVNISSPHTGHLSADLPITAQDVERVDVLEGAAARVFGTQAFTGVINIITKSGSAHAESPSRLSKSPSLSSQHPVCGELALTAGQYGYASLEGRVSAFGQHLSAGYSRSDGATEHSAFQSGRAFLQGRVVLSQQAGAPQLDYQLGYSNKPYDANTFYGASSTDQWERNERWMGAATLRASVGQWHIEPTVSWNRWYDHYQWHKGSPAGENHHRVDTYTANLRNWVRWAGGITALSMEARNEGILSSKLGEPIPSASEGSVAPGSWAKYYTHAASRTNLSANLEHTLVLPHWTLSAGVLANLNTALDTRWRLYPGIDAAWRPHRHWTLAGSWNSALRMPTFTDLYYSGTNIEGSRNLKPERTSDFSLSLRWQPRMLRADVTLTHSRRTDMIDWVVRADDPTQTFRSGNFTLNSTGLRLNAAWLPRQQWANSPLRSISVQYAWLDASTHYPQPITASKYAMEYLRHKVVISADGRLWRSLGLMLSWRWQQRTVDNGGAYDILDARLSWDATANTKMLSAWSVFLDARNLLNRRYFEYGYVRQPGLWVTAGARLAF